MLRNKEWDGIYIKRLEMCLLGGRGRGQIKYKAEVPPRTMVMKKDIKNISCFIDQHISH